MSLSQSQNFNSVEGIRQALGWDSITFSSFKKHVREFASRHGLDPLVSSPVEQPDKWKRVVDEMTERHPTLVNYVSCWPVEAYYNQWAYYRMRDSSQLNRSSKSARNVVVPDSINHISSAIDFDPRVSSNTSGNTIVSGGGVTAMILSSSNVNPCASVRIIRPTIGPENVEFKLPDDPSSGSQLSKNFRPSANEEQAMVLAPEKLRAVMGQNEREFWNMRYELASLFQIHMEVPTVSTLRWVDVDEVKWGTFAEKAGARYPMFLEYEGNWALEVIVRSCLKET